MSEERIIVYVDRWVTGGKLSLEILSTAFGALDAAKERSMVLIPHLMKFIPHSLPLKWSSLFLTGID